MTHLYNMKMQIVSENRGGKGTQTYTRTAYLRYTCEVRNEKQSVDF